MTAYRVGDRLHVPAQELTVTDAPKVGGVYVDDGRADRRATYLPPHLIARLGITVVTPPLVEGAVYQDDVGEYWEVVGGEPRWMHAHRGAVVERPDARDLTRLVPLVEHPPATTEGVPS